MTAGLHLTPKEPKTDILNEDYCVFYDSLHIFHTKNPQLVRKGNILNKTIIAVLLLLTSPTHHNRNKTKLIVVLLMLLCLYLWQFCSFH